MPFNVNNTNCWNAAQVPNSVCDAICFYCIHCFYFFQSSSEPSQQKERLKRFEMLVIVHEYFYMKIPMQLAYVHMLVARVHWCCLLALVCRVGQARIHHKGAQLLCMYNKTEFTRTQSACEVAPLVFYPFGFHCMHRMRLQLDHIKFNSIWYERIFTYITFIIMYSV